MSEDSKKVEALVPAKPYEPTQHERAVVDAHRARA